MAPPPPSMAVAACAALVGRSVRVFLRDATYVTGVLYGVDPESGDLALVQLTEDEDKTVRVKMVLGHAVQRAEADDSASAVTIESMRMALQGSRRVSDELDAVHVAERARRLSELLDKNFIVNSTHDGGATVTVFGGAATLRFPFTASCVECANEQILRRLQALLAQFRPSFND